MHVEHSFSVKFLAYICAVILLPVFIVGPFAYPYLMITNDVRYELGALSFLILICAVLAFCCIKSFYLMIRFFNTLNYKIEYDEDGIILYKNTFIAKFKWNELAKSKEYRSCQIFSLIDGNGKHLFSIWEYASNYNDFRQEIRLKTGI